MSAPATPAERKRQLEVELRTVKAELDYPSSGTYTRYLRERQGQLEQALAEMEAAEKAEGGREE